MRLIGGLGAVAEIGFGDVIAVNITSEEPKKKPTDAGCLAM